MRGPVGALGKPVWVRFVPVPGLTDAPDNIDGVARFVAPMANVEWVEVLPFTSSGHISGRHWASTIACAVMRRARPTSWRAPSIVFVRSAAAPDDRH